MAGAAPSPEAGHRQRVSPSLAAVLTFVTAGCVLVLEIAAVRLAWEEQFGFKFTSDYEHGLSWTAETPKLRANIGVRGPHVVVECTNRELESKAMEIAFKSWK